MSWHETSVDVELGDRSYTIWIGAEAGAGVLERASTLTENKRKCAFVVDSGFGEMQPTFLASMKLLGPVLLLEAGETTKSISQLARIYDFLADHKLDRSSCLFAVGGGVIGDLAGFAAASYLRGIDFYQVPTTLLSMVDSSVGGKTGININAGKNLVGAFFQPQGVYSSTGFLTTLPKRDFNSGMAEIIKHGMLYDLSLFERLEQLDVLHAEHPELPDIIRRNCEIKAAVVQADEKEQASSEGRALLNLGHTFGHAIENVSGYGEYMHGEAIAIGLVMAGELSLRLGNLSQQDVERIQTLISRYSLPTKLEAPLAVNDLLAAMLRDKKVDRGTLRFVGMKSIGQAYTIPEVETELVVEILLKYGAAE
ncbi:MAG: 3-dehydroquinate synthase [Verrucomicrobia bacterium]|nr:3-dehydroquinate synthase [Verrucomicrobiota bacterium]MDA1066779.1 3-dehydroquinate synthase [Verrucomicrobiota bacterium]